MKLYRYNGDEKELNSAMRTLKMALEKDPDYCRAYMLFSIARLYSQPGRLQRTGTTEFTFVCKLPALKSWLLLSGEWPCCTPALPQGSTCVRICLCRCNTSRRFISSLFTTRGISFATGTWTVITPSVYFLM